MTPNSTQFIRATNQISHAQNQRRVIREGSSVLVRIIADKGGGKYEASVAGNRLILTSSSALKTGSTFVGKIALQGGQIVISKNGVEATLTSPEIKTATFIEEGGLFEKIISPELSGFLQAMNLPADNLSFHILLGFKQLGMKLNPAMMKKIRQIAEKSQNPKAMTEKLITLAQKGIDIASVDEVFSNLDEDTPQHPKNDDSALNGGDSQNDKSTLPLFNSLGFGKNHQNENSWIFLPFQIENITEKSVVGDGIVKILLRTNDKSLQMMNVAINYEEKSYRFLINLDGKKITSVKYSIRETTPNSVNTGENESITNQLWNHLNPPDRHPEHEITVDWMPFDLIDGTAAGLEEFSLAGGFA